MKYNAHIIIIGTIFFASIHTFDESVLAQTRGFRGCDRRSPTCQSTPRRWTGKQPPGGYKPDCKKKLEPGFLGDAVACKKTSQGTASTNSTEPR